MKNRDKILLAALELFAKNGYTETSVEKIAKQAGVSKGLTYNHFKNKEELLKVTIERTIIEMTAEMIDLDEPTIETLFQLFFESLRKNAEVIRLCLLLVVHPQTPSGIIMMLDKQKQELLALFTLLLKPKFKKDAKKEAKVLLATIDGITIEYSASLDSKYLRSIQNYLLKRYTK